MALSKEEAINSFLINKDRYKLIAHRLGFLTEGYPENSINNVISIFENEDTLKTIDGIEFDIHFSSDNVPMVVHDFNLADISGESVKVRKTSSCDLKDIKCGYRKSEYSSEIPWENNNNYSLQTLDSLLGLLFDYRSKINDKIIKIETKSPVLKKKDIIELRNLLTKYNSLNDNIVHISFFPWNLKKLRKSERDSSQFITGTELLISYKFERPFVRLWDASIDSISLGIKNKRIEGTMEISEDSEKVAKLNASFYEKRNATCEDWLREIIDKYGYASLYTISDENDVLESLSRLSPEFLYEEANNLIITTDNPKYLKTLK